MKTTLTLDDDLARRLRDIAQRGGESFKAVLNETVRLGLGLQSAKPHSETLPRFVVQPKACGFKEGIDPTKLNQLADASDLEIFQARMTGPRK